MASFNQDLIIFEDDTLLLRYTFTDLEDPFVGTESFWWGAVSSSAWPNTDGHPANISKHNQWNDPIWDSPGTGNITISTPDIVNVFFNQEEFLETNTYVSGNLKTDVEYYTELVFSRNNTQATSVVAATGLLFVSSSMFSIAGYRP